MISEIFENVKTYLPKYLSDTQLKKLMADLQMLYGHINTSALYAPRVPSDEMLGQGDGIANLLVINLPDVLINPKPSLIISNTCDNSLENVRHLPSSICYCPIFNLEKYGRALLEDGENSQSVADHLAAIRRQELISVFYLPVGGRLAQESLVFLDKINSCNSDYVDRSELKNTRIFRLGNAGFYLFLLKLSIRMTRIQEGLDRDKI